MIHLGKYSTSTVISKSICRGGGKVNYRGLTSASSNALGARSHIECDTLILDEKSTSDTIPTNRGQNGDMYIEHEATVSKVNEEQLFYLMSRGLTKNEAFTLMLQGMIRPYIDSIPLESLKEKINEEVLNLIER